MATATQTTIAMHTSRSPTPPLDYVIEHSIIPHEEPDALKAGHWNVPTTIKAHTFGLTDKKTGVQWLTLTTKSRAAHDEEPPTFYQDAKIEGTVRMVLDKDQYMDAVTIGVSYLNLCDKALLTRRAALGKNDGLHPYRNAPEELPPHHTHPLLCGGRHKLSWAGAEGRVRMAVRVPPPKRCPELAFHRDGQMGRQERLSPPADIRGRARRDCDRVSAQCPRESGRA